MKPEILHPVITDEDRRAVAFALESTENAMAALEGLRAEVMRLTGAPDCILTSSCTQALRVSLMTLIDLWPGEMRLMVPDLTFVATAHAALATGCSLQIVDIDPVTLHMNPDSDEWDSDVMMPVELLGRPLHDAFVKSLAENGMPIIVDAAQSFGVTKWRSEYTALCISFAANKIVHGHQGGAILCSVEDGKKVRQYCRHGRDASRPNEYWHVTAGENVAMNPLGAALALSQTKRIEEILERRAKQRGAYLVHGSGAIRVDNVVENGWVHIGYKDANGEHPCDELWKPLHTFPHLKAYAQGKYPNATAAYNGLVFLPSSDDLTPEQIERSYKDEY
jgi:perosamine synthetase